MKSCPAVGTSVYNHTFCGDEGVIVVRVDCIPKAPYQVLEPCRSQYPRSRSTFSNRR